jgi:predicted phage terminase large subunit-like protein
MTASLALEVPELEALSPAEVAELLGLLTPAERARLDEALVPDAPAILTFREFVDRANPRFQWYDHCVWLAAVLQRVADDELLRVIIGAPPRHGKSEEVSRLFTAYYLYRHPERWVGLASYAAELAQTLSRNARDNYVRAGCAVRDDVTAAKHWETTAGGGMWAAGFGGPITGKGAHLLLIDDPIKNAEEAASETVGRRNRDWYRSTFYTRAEPGAAIIVMQTRWPGPGDLVGWLFEEEAEDEPEHWHVVLLEAEKEAEPPAIPATCTLEPDPRAPGEALCPARYPIERLKKIARRIGTFFYSALFQQRPRPRGGEMFPRDLATIVPAAPAGLRWLRYWDKAGTEGGGAYTSGVKMAIGPDDRVYVGDVVRKQVGSDARKRLMRQTAALDGVEVTVWMEQEPGSGGKESAEADIKLLAGFDVHAETATGDKVTRADPFAAQWQAGNVRLVAGAWNKAYLDEMEAAPHGKYKDQMDASSGAFNRLANSGAGLLDFYRDQAKAHQASKEQTHASA